MSRVNREQHHEAPAECRGGGAAAVAPSHSMRRHRFDDDDDEPPATTTQRCRSCAAVAIADCVALGCCPCAVVSLLGLALVKAPLAVGRRCVGRLRRRRVLLLSHKKRRVRDVAAPSAAGSATTTTTRDREEKVVAAAPVTTTMAVTGPAGVEPEPAWLEEMYRAGRWGFGRVSSSSSSSTSGESPAVTS